MTALEHAHAAWRGEEPASPASLAAAITATTTEIQSQLQNANDALREKDEEIQLLKDLLVRSQVELCNLSIWILGDRERGVSLDDHPSLDELPEDVQARVIEMRAAKYGIR